MVEFVTYPKKGQNPAVLTLVLKDNQTLTTAFTVTSNTDYPGPPSPVSLQFAGLLYKPLDQTYDIQISLTSPELVGYIKFSVWDKKGGSKADEFIFKNPTDFNTFTIPTTRLTPERDYELRLLAVSRGDNIPFPIVKDDQGKTSTELIHEFTFDPSATLPSIEIKTIIQKGNDLEVTIVTTNRELVSGYEGWLVDEATNTRVPNSNFSSLPFGADSGILLIPLEQRKVPDGKYTVVVQVLGANNRVYSVAEKEGVVYKAVRPTLLQRIWEALRTSPVILFSIVGILLALILFFMLSALLAKSLTGTPVMQGRLGRGLKSQKGSVVPMADQEPIPPQKSSSPARPSADLKASQPSQPVPLGQQTSRTVLESSADGATMLVSAPDRLTATLELINSGQSGIASGKRFPVKEFPFIIGCQEGKLILPDPSISRRHAQITYDARSNRYLMADLNNSNKTRLNGAALSPEQPRPLENGDLIALGPNVQFRFHLE